jgi:hypothetical protein
MRERMRGQKRDPTAPALQSPSRHRGRESSPKRTPLPRYRRRDGIEWPGFSLPSASAGKWRHDQLVGQFNACSLPPPSVTAQAQRLVGRRTSEPARMPFRERTFDDVGYELRFCLRIRLAGGEVSRAVLRRELTLKILVLASSFAMLTQIVSKGQGSALLNPARFNDMHMVSVRPHRRPMEEGAERIVGMGYVDVPEPRELPSIRLDRLETKHRDLDINDRLRGEPRNRGRAIVIDSRRKTTQRSDEAITLRRKYTRPSGVVTRDL